jgi:hypothetical protein
MEILQMMVMAPCTEEPKEHPRSRVKAPVERSSLVRWCHSLDEGAQYILVGQHRCCRPEQEVEGSKK